MSNTVIQVDNISKLYRLGEISTGMLTQDMKRWWAKKRGKEDPFAKVGVLNDRTVSSHNQYAWALKDISFDVKAGECLGIIGKNGAGKSTLLKILSRVTSPTNGQIKVKGRIASLLEVGTGFHPELTGRENVFLNGAILGMTRQEIRSKFDAIVAFSGVEKYIDTPVKRYSSGMYVRLAFAVAAHLESEILIVDEVLAVGDMEFQKKCLNKMNDIAHNEGRTVLFVSHNMPSIQALCNTGVWLENGMVRSNGDIDTTISQYLKNASGVSKSIEWRLPEEKRANSGKRAQVLSVSMNHDSPVINMGDDIEFSIEMEAEDLIPALQVGLRIFDNRDTLVSTLHNGDYGITLNAAKGASTVTLKLLKPNLLPGDYTCTVLLTYNYGAEVYDVVDACITFSVTTYDVFGSGIPLLSDRGSIWLNAEYKIEQQ